MVALVIVMNVVLVGVMYYSIRSKYEMTNRIRTISHSIDELHRELYEIEKKFSAEMKSISAQQEAKYAEIVAQRYEAPVYDIEELSQPIMESLESFEKALGVYKERVENRLYTLEEQLHSVLIPVSVGDEAH
jgi:septal ring factor EnvC (AmiA/AmiB activator)